MKNKTNLLKKNRKENVHKDLVTIYFCDTKKVFTKKCVTKNIVKFFF
jgi:hypothetical protein